MHGSIPIDTLMLKAISTGLILIFLSPIGLRGEAHRAYHAPQQTPFVERVDLDQDSQVEIIYSDGKIVHPAKEKEQISCDQLAVAPDNQTVGWLVTYKNCCTSYPIPMMLVIYKSGKVVQRIRDEQMMWDWYFWAGGKQVVYHADTVHGNLGPHSVLLDVKTGKVVDRYAGNPDDDSPRWTKRPK